MISTAARKTVDGEQYCIKTQGLLKGDYTLRARVLVLVVPAIGLWASIGTRSGGGLCGRVALAVGGLGLGSTRVFGYGGDWRGHRVVRCGELLPDLECAYRALTAIATSSCDSRAPRDDALEAPLGEVPVGNASVEAGVLPDRGHDG